MNFLREHIELTQSIEERIRLHFGLIPQSDGGEVAVAEKADAAAPAPKKRGSSKRARPEAN